MFRDVREPEPVRRIGTEYPLHVVVEHGRAGLLALAPPAALRGREDPGLRAQLPRRPATHPPASPARLVGQVSVAERRVLVVRIVQRIDPIGAEHIRVPDRVASPPVVGLAGELKGLLGHSVGVGLAGR